MSEAGEKTETRTREWYNPACNLADSCRAVIKALTRNWYNQDPTTILTIFSWVLLVIYAAILLVNWWGAIACPHSACNICTQLKDSNSGWNWILSSVNKLAGAVVVAVLGIKTNKNYVENSTRNLINAYMAIWFVSGISAVILWLKDSNAIAPVADTAKAFINIAIAAACTLFGIPVIAATWKTWKEARTATPSANS